MSRIEVLTGPERRRSWSDEEKRAIVAAASVPGAVVSDVARQADVHSSLIYRWRRELRSGGSAGFSEVVVAPVAEGSGAGSSGIEVALVDGTRVRIPPGTSPDLAATVLRALRR